MLNVLDLNIKLVFFQQRIGYCFGSAQLCTVEIMQPGRIWYKNFVAGIEHRCHGDRYGLICADRDDNIRYFHMESVVFVEFLCDGFAQRFDTVIRCIIGITIVDRFLGCVFNELRRVEVRAADTQIDNFFPFFF